MSEFGYPLYPVAPTNQQALSSITGTTVLGVGAATYSKHFFITGAGGYTITLPALDGVNFPTGSFSIFNNSSALCTIQTAGSDTVLLLGSSYSSVSILPGERFLVQNMVSSYIIGLESPQRTTTAPQFDSTIRAASTAFVQTALGNFSNVTGLSTATTLTASQAGQFFNLTATANFTLPLASTVPQGAVYAFQCTGGTPSVVRQGSDVISINGATITSMGLGTGDWVTVVRVSSTTWFMQGSTSLGSSSAFTANRASAGYQKLPGGVIFQWGSTGAISQGSWAGVTYPIVFPTGLFNNPVISPITGSANSNGYSMGAALATTSGFNATNNSGTSGAVTGSWIAIGW